MGGMGWGSIVEKGFNFGCYLFFFEVFGFFKLGVLVVVGRVGVRL